MTYCTQLQPFITLIKTVVGVIQFGIPIALILLAVIDLGKAVIASDDKEVKAAQSRLIKRFIYAALVFLVVTLVNFVMSIVSDAAANSQDGNANVQSPLACWNNSGSQRRA